MNKPDFYIVIGASAGGLNATTELISHLPENLNIAVFVVLHLSKVGMGDFLVHRLQKYTSYTCKIARNGEIIAPRHIYIAPPDEHLLLKDTEIVLGNGPAENRWRPSIDILFRSAAAQHTNKVIGITLTGYLNDGTAGMQAIKRCGGFCIVQDPNEAEYPDMPLSVIEHMNVDFCIALATMGETIEQIIEQNKPVPQSAETAKEVRIEANIAANAVVGIEVVSQLGDKSLYSCPDCGGGLWHVNEENLKRYRCHIGHAYTEDYLVLKQVETIESTLWVAVRMMEERRNLLKNISQRETERGFVKIAKSHWEKALEMEEHIRRLKEVLYSGQQA